MKWTESVNNALFDIARDIGPWIVPLAPALVFGHSAYSAVFSALGLLAYAVGLSVAIALEIGGIIGFHAGVSFYGRHNGKAVLGFSLGVVYVILGITAVLVGGESPDFKIIGVMSFLIVPLVYLARALMKDLGDTSAADADDKAHRREMDLFKLETNRQTRLITAERKTVQSVQPVQSKSVHTEPESVQPMDIDEAIIERFATGEKVNVSRLARDLGKSRTTVYKRIGQLELNKNGHNKSRARESMRS